LKKSKVLGEHGEGIMRKLVISVIFVTIFLASCKSNKSVANAAETSRNELKGTEWKLIEVRINNRNIGFDRNALVRQGFNDIYTLRFDEELLGGVGAPNRYSAPYTLGSKQTINILLIRSTMMASLREPENLREHDYYAYMQNVYEWKLAGSNLELFSKTDDGREVRLLFTL
jgi:heat shock protein HslJ